MLSTDHNLSLIVKGDKKDELCVRPSSLSEFIGQKKIVDNLEIYIEAAKLRNEVIDHILFSGPPGLGKTTLARIINQVQEGNFYQLAAPNIKRPGDIIKLLMNIEAHDTFFIDEIHRLPVPVEEVLYSAMEDGTVDISLVDHSSASTIKLTLPPFTLVGATTRAGLLTAPLRDRFGIHFTLDYYDNEELQRVLQRTAKIWNVSIDDEAVSMIATRSRRTPRIAIRLLRRIWDHAIVEAKRGSTSSVSITSAIVSRSLHKMHIDTLGLTTLDRAFLTTLAESYQGGPTGIKPIASMLAEDEITLEDFVEPFLVQLGLVKRTSRGRVLTNLALQHLNITTSGSIQESGLFI